MALQLVKNGEPDGHPEMLKQAEDACAVIMATVKAGGSFIAFTDDGQEFKCHFAGEPLRMAVAAEEMGRGLKCQLAGIE